MLKIRECRIGNQMSGKPENVRVWQPDSLSPWEMAREREASRRLASLAKDTNLLSERDSVFEKAVVPRGQEIHYEVLYVFDCDYCCCFIYCYSSRFVGNTINIFC